MDLQLQGKKAVVTGGSRGIGKAIARQLAMEGCDVAICARNEGPLQESADELARAVANESDERVVSEAADLLFHLVIALRSRDLGIDSVLAELDRRAGRSGHEEKANRPSS